jgi:YbbR domain-containing protein
VTDIPAVRPRGSLQRRLIAAFTDRLLLKATAVFIAVVLWFVVSATEPEVVLIGVRFAPVLLDSSLVLRDPLPPIQAKVAGSPKQLIKLGADPPMIRRQITADAPDTLVLDLRPEDVILPDGVDAVVLDVQPRRLPLHFESRWSRKVPIVSAAIEVVAPPGTGPLRAQFEPEVVQVTGPRRLVLQVSSVRTTKTTIPYPDSLAHLVDIDTAALGPGVRVRPTQVKVQVTLASPHR